MLTKDPSSLRLFAQRSSRPWEAEEISRLASWACLSKLTQINKMSRYAFHSTTLLLTVLHHRCVVCVHYDYETYVTCINFWQLFYVAKKSKKELSYLFHKMFATKVDKVVITHCYQVNFWPVICGSLSIFWLTLGTTISITHFFWRESVTKQCFSTKVTL